MDFIASETMSLLGSRRWAQSRVRFKRSSMLTQTGLRLVWKAAISISPTNIRQAIQHSKESLYSISVVLRTGAIMDWTSVIREVCSTVTRQTRSIFLAERCCILAWTIFLVTLLTSFLGSQATTQQ